MLKTKNIEHIKAIFQHPSKEHDRHGEFNYIRIYEPLTDERLEFLAEAFLHHRRCCEQLNFVLREQKEKEQPKIEFVKEYQTFEAFIRDNTNCLLEFYPQSNADDYLKGKI